MDNKLTTWIQSNFALELDAKIKETIKKSYSLDDRDFMTVDNGFKFMFDDESNGDIQISINEHGDTHNITITGEFDWEVVHVYSVIQSLLTDIVEGAA